MARRRIPKKYSPEVLLKSLGSSDPETRWMAARNLGQYGDLTTILPLERVALEDNESFSREGAFVDTIEYPSSAAFEALAAIYARHPPALDDLVRVSAHLTNLDLGAGYAEQLATGLGKAAIEIATPLLRHVDPRVRLRATNVLARVQRDRINLALWSDDEDVRLAGTQQDAYRPELVRDALTRFPEEPSVRVRRGICDLWLRYRARMGGWLHSRELADQLVDPDPEIHTRVAEHVLATARRRSTSPWIDDPGGLLPVRDRLAALLESGSSPVMSTLREVLDLVDDAIAPFAGRRPQRP